MTRKRKLQEKIKTVNEIQERYSNTSNFFKELEKVKEEYQIELNKELKNKSVKQTAKKPTKKK